jgi:hypothetical protein
VSLDIGYTDTFMTCMRNAGIVMLYSGDILDADNGMFRQYPNFYDIGTMSQDRYMADLVRSLVRQDYFSGWNTALGRPGTAPAKVGIVSAADASWERPLDHVLLPALAAAGHPVSPQNIVRVPDPNSQSDQGPGVSAVTAAELRFAQQGVTHVILLDNRGGLTLIFSNAARSQHYHPRYALNSGMGVQALHDSDAIATDQLNGAVGVGWQPSVDLPAAAGNAYATPATKQCLDIMKRRTGQTYDSTNAASLALDYCDQMFFLRDAIDHAGPVLTEQTVTAAIDAIHGSFTPAVIPRAYVSAARHDAAQLAWDMYWDGGCTCVKYRNEHVVP